MVSRRVIFAVLMISSLLIATACSNEGRVTDNPVTVSTEEALLFFQNIVKETLEGRFDLLCKNAANETRCKHDVLDIGMLTPVTEPVIRCVYSDRVSVSEDSPLGQVIVVEGENRLGEPFTTEVFVFRDGGRLVAKNILWWSGLGYSSEYPFTTASEQGSANGTQCLQ